MEGGVRLGQTPADMSSSHPPSYLLWDAQINPHSAHMLQQQQIQPELSRSEVNCRWLTENQIILSLLTLPNIFHCEWSLWFQLVVILMGADLIADKCPALASAEILPDWACVPTGCLIALQAHHPTWSEKPRAQIGLNAILLALEASFFLEMHTLTISRT